MTTEMTTEQAYYYALEHIAKEFLSTDQLRRQSGSRYGLTYEEALEMAYENMQSYAAQAIKGKRRPKSP